MAKQAYHGGAFFDAVGDDFATLEKSGTVINADVLDAWFDPSPKAVEKLKTFLPYALRTSPPTHAEGLIATLAAKRGIPREEILVAGGSSDIMFTLFPRLLKKGDTVMILDPMYGEYPHIFQHVVEVDIMRYILDKKEEFRVDMKAFADDVRERRPKAVVLVNPNSPTGKYVERHAMIEFLDAIPPETAVVVDETYIEYVDPKKSLETEVARRPNLMIIKSMSKVYGLSGARVGYLVAHPSWTERLATFIPPWSVSLLGQIAAVEALRDEAYYAEKYSETHRLREAFMQSVADIGSVKVFDSVANFFLVELLDAAHHADAIVTALRKKNIFIRNCDSVSSQFKNNFLRIAVKDEAGNQKITAALKEALGV